MQRVCRLQDHFHQLREQRELPRPPGGGGAGGTDIASQHLLSSEGSTDC